jgi:predicted RNase H-like HicB family nuclease
MNMPRAAFATRYVALVDGERGKYGVVVPDLPGCTSGGKTVDQALSNAVEAVRLWVEDAEADGEDLPHPRSPEVLRADPDVAAALAQGAMLAAVPVLRDAGRAVKANLSLDAGLLEAIDAAAEAHGLTRSAFITSAAREKIVGGGKVRSLMPVLRETSARRDVTQNETRHRSRIHANEEYEVRYWSKKLGVSQDQLKAAVEKITQPRKAPSRTLREAGRGR